MFLVIGKHNPGSVTNELPQRTHPERSGGSRHVWTRTTFADKSQTEPASEVPVVPTAKKEKGK